jgi:hypothetical protein
MQFLDFCVFEQRTSVCSRGKLRVFTRRIFRPAAVPRPGYACKNLRLSRPPPGAPFPPARPVPVRCREGHEIPHRPVGNGLDRSATFWVGIVFLCRGGEPPGLPRRDSAACPSLRGPILSARAERIGRKARQREGLFTKPPFPLESHPPKFGGRAGLDYYRARSRPPAVPRNRTGSGMSDGRIFDGAPVGNGLDHSANRTGVRRAGQDPPLRGRGYAGGYHPPARPIPAGTQKPRPADRPRAGIPVKTYSPRGGFTALVAT